MINDELLIIRGCAGRVWACAGRTLIIYHCGGGGFGGNRQAPGTVRHSMRGRVPSNHPII